MPALSTDSTIDSRTRKLLLWVHARKGVAHTSDARAAGFSPYVIAAAVHAGVLTRVRRSSVVSADADPRRLAAAKVGGRLTCVSSAEVQELWVPSRGDDRAIHVAVPATASRLDRAGLHLHWGTGPAPVARNATEDPALNVLFHVAHCLPRADALAVWESAIRKNLVDAGALHRVAWRSADAAALAAVASDLSDSGLETRFVHGLRAAGVVVRQQVWIDGHPVDGLIGDSLVVQIDGFSHHSTAADRRRDLRADARLIARGYVVLRFDYQQILFDWDMVSAAVLLVVAQGAHLRPVRRTA